MQDASTLSNSNKGSLRAFETAKASQPFVCPSCDEFTHLFKCLNQHVGSVTDDVECTKSWMVNEIKMHHWERISYAR